MFSLIVRLPIISCKLESKQVRIEIKIDSFLGADVGIFLMPCGLKDLVIKLIIKPCGFKMCPHEKKKKESALENDYVYVCMYVC